MAPPQEPLRYAKTVASGCNPLPIWAHGKEGVDGSSPSEGFRKRPARWRFVFARQAASSHRRTQDRHILGAENLETFGSEAFERRDALRRAGEWLGTLPG